MRSSWPIVAAVSVATLACFTQSADCPSDLPAACPASGPPSYQADIAPILDKECVSCHSPGGIAANSPLDSYGAVFARRGSVLDQVYACKMPQAGLPGTERQPLLVWLVCGAPNN